MKIKTSMKRLMLGMASVMVMFCLAGCGSTSTQSSESSSASSQSSTKTTAASKARDTANNQIMSGQYKEALKTLLAVKNPDSQTRSMIKDLQKYLAAQDAYNDQEYEEAASDLASVSSSSKPMRSAFISMKNKVKQAQQSASTSSASQTSTSTSNSTSASSAASSSSSAANSQAASQTGMDVIDAFAAKMSFNQSSYGIIPEGKDGDVYTFEVRQNNDDNTVAHLIGIYQYNAVTGAVEKIG
ncbi:hypothetical protein PO148_00530 [Limosilactobacillus mucosae]|uniref:Lipoprotein n=1 Tax=Limosilactobacillus mucosae TaxID=97478 RepID=A0AAJ1HT39_LIMMU|nr:hypothetical protein [Limosilactobacillus mucosae]MDC2829029.1 hypothetical protein [Limosilactobacillus mucosae]MDC2836450.1 hypothetical protein [Limosilactobacillus mucosae]MDC2848496.1 hypothetical protein [Limosilactobacillus mucosae]MDC2852678.1 hypothetical protein [Limosilactobacillus mucosae]